jgi:hypothetical protein
MNSTEILINKTENVFFSIGLAPFAFLDIVNILGGFLGEVLIFFSFFKLYLT